MLNPSSKAGKYIWIFIYILFTVLLGDIILLSLMAPQHKLSPALMAFGTILGTLMLGSAFFLWHRIPCKKALQSPFLYAVLMVLYGILLYMVSSTNRIMVESSFDYKDVWYGAAELAKGKPLSSETYFLTYSNNIKPMLYLSLLFRASEALHFKDPFYFVLLVSVFEILAAVWSVGYLAGNSKKERAEYRIPILFLFVFALPIWALVQSFYTDSMSFAFAAIALSLTKRALETRPGSKMSLILLVFAGIFVGIGLSVKVTVAIPFIACVLVLCSCRLPAIKWIRIGILAICAIVVFLLTDLWAADYEIWNKAKETSDPLINWIAIGMKEDGSWIANRDYVIYTHSLPTKAEKAKYAWHYITENHNDFWNITHLIQKARYNFASGRMGTQEFAQFKLTESNLIFEHFSLDGKYAWRTSELCFCYLFSIYSIYLLCAIISIYRLARGRGIPAAKAVADLTLLGMILFLMIWEANNRQLYNQLPIIILGTVLNIRLITAGKNSAQNFRTASCCTAPPTKESHS